MLVVIAAIAVVAVSYRIWVKNRVAPPASPVWKEGEGICRDVEAGLANWLPKWIIEVRKHRNPAFPGVNFTLQYDEPIDSRLTAPASEDELRERNEDEERRYSPDRLKYIDLSGAFGEMEPDTEVALVDLTKKERRRILYFGPAVGIDDAAWIDAETFIIAGHDEETGNVRIQGTRSEPVIWLFRLRENRVATCTAVEE